MDPTEEKWQRTRERRPLRAAGLALGFALGGFFDSILLHQILQWHHLLSALDEGRLGDPRFQVTADGIFDAAMYVVGIAGLVMLLKARHALVAPWADRLLASACLVGFGAWHVADAVLAHWLLRLHRIRMNTDDPLLWDLVWLVLFGLIPLAAGILLGRDRSGPAYGRSRSGPLIALLVLAAAALAIHGHQA